MENENIMKNGSGYTDSVAGEAITNMDNENVKKPENKEYTRYRKFVGCILRICELSGYHLEERIVVRDIRTGKIWK